MKLKKLVTISANSTASMKSRVGTELRLILEDCSRDDTVILSKVGDNKAPVSALVNQVGIFDKIIKNAVTALGPVRNGANTVVSISVFSNERDDVNIVYRYNYDDNTDSVSTTASSTNKDNVSALIKKLNADVELQRETLGSMFKDISDTLEGYGRIDIGVPSWLGENIVDLRLRYNESESGEKVDLKKRDILRLINATHLYDIHNIRMVYSNLQLIMENLNELFNATIELKKAQDRDFNARIASIESEIEQIKASLVTKTSGENTADEPNPETERPMGDITINETDELIPSFALNRPGDTKKVRAKKNVITKDVVDDVNANIEKTRQDENK